MENAKAWDWHGRLMPALLLAWLLLCFAPGAFAQGTGAQETGEMRAVFEIGEASASAEYALALGPCPESIELVVPGDAHNVSASVAGAAVSTTAHGGDFEMGIVVPLAGLDDCGSVVLRYESAEVVERSARNFFLVEVVAPVDIGELAVEVRLPAGAVLEKPAADGGSAFPRDYALSTDGQRIALSWERRGLAAGDSVALFVVYAHGFPVSWFWAVAGLAVVLAAGAAAIAYLKFFKRGKPALRKKRQGTGLEKRESAKGLAPAKKLEALESVEEHLLEDERKVVGLLKEAGGEMKQKHILRGTGMSKAKLSRVLRNLEERKLVQKSPEGKTNAVKLLE